MSTSFDLVEQPWVPVLDEHHRCHEVSLVDLFTGAHRWRGLAGDMPTQQVALLRLLLAICHRALREEISEAGAARAWSRWWANGFPAEKVVAYLRRWRHRFDLFDSEAPFMQVAGLHTATGTTSGLSKLIAEIPDRAPYFTTRAGEGLSRVSAAEAARWVVHCQAFDPSGTKTGAVGDPRVKGGPGYPIGVGWCGHLGLVLAEGRNLAETLLLNLVLDHPSTAEDIPVWEREEPLTAAVDPVLATRGRSHGPVELLVWQSRRIRLIPRDDGHVVDALVCNGDPHEMQNAHGQEAMSGWKRSANQEKKGDHGPIVYMPMRHDPDRAVWRGLAGLLAGAASVRGATNDAPVLLPPLVEWLSVLADKGALAEDHPLRFHAIGIEYGVQQSSIDGVVDDAMTLQAAVLTDPDLRHAVVTAAVSTEAAVAALRNLAGNLRLASGGDADGARARVAERAWSRLDRPFRDWTNRLRAETDVDDALTAWHRTAFRILRQEGEALVVEAGEKAWRGREVSNSKGSWFVDSAVAEAWFRAALRKVLDRAYPTPSDTTENTASDTGETA